MRGSQILCGAKLAFLQLLLAKFTFISFKV
nr:MAG TPA: hypothetical protein [Caudoviricetes sp.]